MLSLARSRSTARLARSSQLRRLATTAQFLKMTITDTATNKSTEKLVHPLFLRERDQNDEFSQQPTGQRYFEPTDYLDIPITSSTLTPSNLSVTFADNHTTEFTNPNLLASIRSTACLRADPILLSRGTHTHTERERERERERESENKAQRLYDRPYEARARTHTEQSTASV